MSNVTETKTILGAGKTASSSLAKNRNTPDIIRTSRPAESDGRGEGERKVPVTTMLESTRTSKIAKVERKKEDGTVGLCTCEYALRAPAGRAGSLSLYLRFLFRQ